MEHSKSGRVPKSGDFNLSRPLAEHARRALRHSLSAGVEAYDRGRHLPRLIAMTPAQLADSSLAARRIIVARLARALRAERSRGRAGHWTYDLNRHIGLHQAYTAERARLPFAERSK